MLERKAAVSRAFFRESRRIDIIRFEAQIIFDIRILLTDLIVCTVKYKCLNSAADSLCKFFVTFTETDRIGFNAEVFLKKMIG